ncbi:hypothetical protein BJV77DRAFT_1188118 [Russula vinacea]|nr:hypothetical protein BJV77DRAFT_1188118 [Russula vinacea]
MRLAIGHPITVSPWGRFPVRPDEPALSLPRDQTARPAGSSHRRQTRRRAQPSCLFCRERKIACGAPPVGSADMTCNQCARRSRKCEYPTMSRRRRRESYGFDDAGYLQLGTPSYPSSPSSPPLTPPLTPPLSPRTYTQAL